MSYSLPPESDGEVFRGLLVYGPRGGQVIEVVTCAARRATRRVAPQETPGKVELRGISD